MPERAGARALIVVIEDRQLTLPKPPLGLDRPLLTAAQVAELLVNPTSSVYEYAHRWQDPLPCIHIGRHRCFDRADVAAWLTRQRTARA